MRIDSYSFGKVTVRDQSYDSDVIVFPDRIQDRWWRKQGHSLCPEDLQTVLEANPDTLIVGCGMYGAMQIPEETKQWISEKGMVLMAYSTGKAIEAYNELADRSRVVLCLHLTC